MAFRLKALRVIGISVFLFSLILLVFQLSRFCLFGWDCSIDLLVRYIRSVFISIPWIVFEDLSCYIFFVQSILADRYIHRRELRLVSLESLSSVEYGIKKTFLIFVFDTEISRFKLSRK